MFGTKPVISSCLLSHALLWPSCIADADIIFLPCGFYLLSFFYSSSYSLISKISQKFILGRKFLLSQVLIFCWCWLLLCSHVVFRKCCRRCWKTLWFSSVVTAATQAQLTVLLESRWPANRHCRYTVPLLLLWHLYNILPFNFTAARYCFSHFCIVLLYFVLNAK